RPRPPAEGRRGRAADRRAQTPGLLLHVPRRRRRGGADALRGAVVDGGEQPRRQGATGLRAAPGLDPAGGAADGAGGDAAVLAGRAVVQPRRPPALRAATAALVPLQ